jgi:hypothetical protein
VNNGSRPQGDADPPRADAVECEERGGDEVLFVGGFHACGLPVHARFMNVRLVRFIALLRS